MASTNPSTKTIIFKCYQHAALISEKLQDFYEQNNFFDTVLIAGSNSVNIQAHRVVLCAMSEYFFELFRGDQSAFKENVVELKEIEAPTLKIIIDFMYSGSIELSVETVEGILRTASFLKIKYLVDGCCELIEENIDSNNSLSWFRLGYELNLPTLKTTAEEYIYPHFKEISKQTELLMLSEIELKDLLFNENSRDKNFEEDIFLAMVTWLNSDKLNRKHLVLQLLSMVRFQALTPKFIVENRKSVCETVESYELLCSWVHWHFLSAKTQTIDQGNFKESQQNCTLKLIEKKKKKLAVIRTTSKLGQINIETFNPKENVWSIEIQTLCWIKQNFITVIGIDGKLIVPGGKDDNTRSVEFLDLHTSNWIDLPLMKQTKDIFQMADLNGNLCVVGCGINDNSVSMEIYNFSTHKWHYIQPLTEPSIQVKIATHNEMLYLLDFDHGCLQCYNVSSKKWTLKEIKRQSLTNFCLAAVEGFLYVIGGYCCVTSKWVETVERFNLFNDSWYEVASLPPCNISYLKSTVLENRIIISDSVIVFEYHPDSVKWNISSTLNTKNYARYTFNIFNFTAKN